MATTRLLVPVYGSPDATGPLYLRVTDVKSEAGCSVARISVAMSWSSDFARSLFALAPEELLSLLPDPVLLEDSPPLLLPAPSPPIFAFALSNPVLIDSKALRARSSAAVEAEVDADAPGCCCACCCVPELLGASSGFCGK